jgi:2,4-dienoyl-CoA reductase-like NADH-dependent reductase (Old Yellow Enzyme family)
MATGQSLLTPLKLGPYALRNRIVMAPLTRTRAGDRNVPREMNVVYYRQRATAGLISAKQSHSCSAKETMTRQPHGRRVCLAPNSSFEHHQVLWNQPCHSTKRFH